MSTGSFDYQLNHGLYGEDLISQWLVRRGWQVLPAYQIEVNHGKGPRLFGPYGSLISPDLLVFNQKEIMWVEAKTKSAFTWHRLSSSWQTGIDRRHWLDYLQVEEVTPMPVWILFLHRPGLRSKDQPPNVESPSGLYGNHIAKLQISIHHEHANHGPTGMVYWCESALIRLAPYADMAVARKQTDVK